jgi:hypothetical protein
MPSGRPALKDIDLTQIAHPKAKPLKSKGGPSAIKGVQEKITRSDTRGKSASTTMAHKDKTAQETALLSTEPVLCPGLNEKGRQYRMSIPIYYSVYP